MFENTNTKTEQGDIGEARAIYEYTKLGYNVSIPLSNGLKYDLIVDINNKLFKVQCKTTKYIAKKSYVVTLKTSGGNKSSYSIRNRKYEDYDILFVLTADNICYSIPSLDFDAKTTLTLNSTKDKYII